MINLIEIQGAITLKLKRAFPKYSLYTDGNREDIVGDAFHISLRPLLSTGYRGYKNRLINVDISYISKRGTGDENLIMIDALEYLFYLVLNVTTKDKKVIRKLYIEDLNTRVVDGVLTCGFTLDYNSGVDTRYVPDIDGDLGYEPDAEEGEEGYIDKMRRLHIERND